MTAERAPGSVERLLAVARLGLALAADLLRPSDDPADAPPLVLGFHHLATRDLGMPLTHAAGAKQRCCLPPVYGTDFDFERKVPFLDATTMTLSLSLRGSRLPQTDWPTALLSTQHAIHVPTSTRELGADCMRTNAKAIAAQGPVLLDWCCTSRKSARTAATHGSQRIPAPARRSDRLFT